MTKKVVQNFLKSFPEKSPVSFNFHLKFWIIAPFNLLTWLTRAMSPWAKICIRTAVLQPLRWTKTASEVSSAHFTCWFFHVIFPQGLCNARNMQSFKQNAWKPIFANFRGLDLWRKLQLYCTHVYFCRLDKQLNTVLTIERAWYNPIKIFGELWPSTGLQGIRWTHAHGTL